MKTIVLCVLLGMLFVELSGCAYHEYDPKEPEKYFEFWCDPWNYDNTAKGELSRSERMDYEQYCKEQLKR